MQRSILSVCAAALALCSAFSWPQNAMALQSRTYAVSMLSLASNSQEGDCAPRGVNIPWEKQRLRNLADLGYSQGAIEALVAKEVAGGGASEIDKLMVDRGRINGEPVNAVAYPAAVVDPKLNALTGKYAYGFDLDGKGPDQPNAFEDPETHQKGVDDELYRTLGCISVFRGTLDSPATYWTYIWGQLRDSQPALLITLSGEDLDKDGDVTITFDRALEHLRSNVDGTPRADATYRVDTDPRSHNVFRGLRRKGVVTLIGPYTGDFRVLLNPLLIPELRLKRVQMRFTFTQDGSLRAMIGGYEPWADLYWAFAAQGPGGENCVFGDIPGIYYLFKKHADGDPDPKTGQNVTISSTYYAEAVPVFTGDETRARNSGATR
jgi:hypothetical protein